MPLPAEVPEPPFAFDPVHPDLLAWARQTLDAEEFIREMREIQRTGGCSIEDVLADIHAITNRPRE